MLTIILWLLLIGALLGIAVVVLRKFPQLILLDVDSIARERHKKVKYDLIRQRVERGSRELAGGIRRKLRPLARVLLFWIRKIYDRVLELERRYRHLGKEAERNRRIAELMVEASALAKVGETKEAERRLISVISLDPKHLKAYEEIGRLALREKHWNEAEQAFQFVLKLNPDDASAHAYYGELESARGNLSAAVLRFEDAVRRKPASPKYLSFLLDAAIAAGNRDLARATFAKLKEVNPENQKLPEFEQKIRGI